MLDLIFRCRERMAIVYGRIPPGALVGERFRDANVSAALPRGKPKRPGEVVRSARTVSVRPMPPRVRPRD